MDFNIHGLSEFSRIMISIFFIKEHWIIEEREKKYIRWRDKNKNPRSRQVSVMYLN
jgi:hypothetical protein